MNQEKKNGTKTSYDEQPRPLTESSFWHHNYGKKYSEGEWKNPFYERCVKEERLKEALDCLYSKLFDLFGHETGGTMGEIYTAFNEAFPALYKGETDEEVD